MRRSLLFAQLVLSGLLFSTQSKAAYIGIIVFDQEYYQGSVNEECNASWVTCAPTAPLMKSGDQAACITAGNSNLRVTSTEDPGVQSMVYEYINSCGYPVSAKIRSGNSWSGVVSLPAGTHRWINASYGSYADNPVEIMFGNSTGGNPAPQPNPNPNQPAPKPSIPVTRPPNSDRPGQCKPGVGNSNIPGHSVINLERQSVSEIIPIVGAPFDLIYSSDRLKRSTEINPRSGMLGGWALSIQHFLDAKNKVLYLGSGGVIRVTDDLNFNSDGSITIYNVIEKGSAAAFNKNGQLIIYYAGSPFHAKWTFSYEGAFLSSVKDEFNRVYTFTKFGITTPSGQKTELVYDENSNLSKVTNPNNESYSLSSDKNGRLLTFTKPSGLKTIIKYDEAGNLVSDSGALNTVTLSQEYSTSTGSIYTKALSSSNKFLGGVLIEPQSDGVRVTHKNDFGADSASYRSEKFAYTDNAFYSDIYGGTSKSEVGSSETYHKTTTKTEFKSADTIIWARSEKWTDSKQVGSGKTLKSIFTENFVLNGNPKQKYKLVYPEDYSTTTVTTPLGKVINLSGNYFTKNISSQVADLAPINYSFDALGRLSLIKQGERQQSFAYDNFGNLSSTVNGLGIKTTYEYDKANRPVKQTFPDGNSMEFSYDLDGNLTRIKPPGKPDHSFVTGLTGLVESYLPPSIQSKVTGSTVYSYDQDKMLTKISRPDGKNVEFIYEQDSFRLSSLKTPDGNYSLQYAPGKNGKTDLVSEILAPSGVKTNISYVWALPTSVTTTGDVNSTVSYSYNTDMSLGAISVAGSDGKAVVSNKISYDLDMLPVAVGSLAMTRNNAGAVSATTLGKVIESIGYNAFGEPISSGFTVDKKPLFGMSYNRDKVGRISASQDVTGVNKVISSYEYDTQGRLSKVTKGADVRSYAYDANGNRLSFSGNGKSYAGTYDEQDRLLSYGNSKFEYNDNGDLQTRTDINPDTKEVKATSYTYDVFGNLRKVVLPDNRVIEYVIDGQNRRIGKKIDGKVVQAFIYQSQYQIAAEMDGSGKIVKSFVYASKINIPDYVNYNGKQYRIISDQVGTPKMIVDSATGAVAESFNYDEFGISQDGKVSNIIPFGFAGGLYDADTGLVRFGARDYSPIVGRWTNKDPSGFNGGMSNLYGYANFDPINFIDVNGKHPLLVAVAAVGVGAAVGGVVGGIMAGVTSAIQGEGFVASVKSGINGAVGGAVGGALATLAVEGSVVATLGSVVAGVGASIFYGVDGLGNATKDYFKALVYVNNTKSREQQLLDCADGKN